MKVLLITSSEEDYLQDSIIHGFKELFGRDAIDYPVKDILYNDYLDLKKIRGNGFTLYGLLDSTLKPDCIIDIETNIENNKFDLIVFTSIYRQYEIFYKHVQLFIKSNVPVWVMDGEDSPVLFPYLGKHLKKFIPAIKPHKYFTYFKRELLPETLNSVYLRFPVSKFVKNLSPKNVQPIAFSIPKEKIIKTTPAKTKLFATHIVDQEIANKIYSQSQQKLFDSEKDYYQDLQNSKFGITAKRAGWDCLRHYEIAANSAVMCFRDLDKKTTYCAPHGLISGKNCIGYTSYTELMYKINQLSENDYNNIQRESLNWIHQNSTVIRVKELMGNYYK